MRHEDQRRIPRVTVCCRVDVRDQFGLWTAVTDDVCARGCRLVTPKLPRAGSALELRISSDLFPESLEVAGEVAWVSGERVGVSFLEAGARGRMTPAEWVANVIDLGRVHGPEPLDQDVPRVAPAISRGRPVRAHPPRRATGDGAKAAEGAIVALPPRKR